MLKARGGKRLLERFSDRSDIGVQRARIELWNSMPSPALDELAELIQTEFGIPFGLLRPEDPIGRLVAPLPVQNLLTWIWTEAALEDATSELNYQLAKRRPDLNKDFGFIRTVEDLVRAWCEPAT